MIDQAEGLVDDKYMVGGSRIVYDLSSGRSVYRLQLDSRKKEKQSGWLFVYFSVPFGYFLSLFKRDFDRLPDIGRDLQIVCDKQIVGAD